MSRGSLRLGHDGLRVLVVGGGVAALEALLALRALAGDLVDLELLAPETRFFYRPQAPLEPFGGGRVASFELGEITRIVGAELTLGELASVEPENRIARTGHGMEIRYEVLLLATGAAPRPAVQADVTFRGPSDSERTAELLRAEAGAYTLAVPVPRTWPLPVYEVAFGLRAGSGKPVTVMTVEPTPAAVLGRAGSAAVASLLERRGIAVEAGFDFAAQPRREITIAAPALHAQRIYGIPADEDGFVPVNRYGEVHGLPDVYAAGDVTGYEVKHGSLAAAQADAAAAAIAVLAGAAIAPTPFKPILYARVACGGESLYVRRDLDDLRDEGMVSRDPLWAPPAKIFARHLAPALAELAGGPVPTAFFDPRIR
jgi:sulfide:quinone oxidoreductase